MNGWRWACRPLILAGAMALTTGASFAQQAATGTPASASGGTSRTLTGTRLTATVGAVKPGGAATEAPTVRVDPTLGTVITFHGNRNGPSATPTLPTASGPSGPAQVSGRTGVGPTVPAPGTSATVGIPSDGPVWTFHGGRSGVDPEPATTPTGTADGATSPASEPAPGTAGTVLASPSSVPSAPAAKSTPAPIARAVLLALPSGSPKSLPPLPPMPGGDPAGMAGDLPLPPSGSPFVPNGDPAAKAPVGAGLFGSAVPTASPDASDPVEDHWATLMQNEAAHLTQESSVPMTVVVVRTRDLVMRRFIAESIMHQDTTRYSEADSGLSALFSMGSRVNGSDRPTCYILFRRDKITALRDQFLAPMSAKVGEAAAVAFVIGHETGHCLDYYERQRTFPTKGLWTADQTQYLGIAPAAAHRIFPNGMTPAAYDQAAPMLYGDLAQRQYEERIADVFGVMWAVHRGFPDRLFDDVFDARKWIPRTGDHATAPALVDLRQKYNALPVKDFAHLWALARQVQQDIGVNREVGDGASVNAAHFDGADRFYSPGTSTRPDDPTHGPQATVVGLQRVQVRPFGQTYTPPTRAAEPPPTVVGLPQKIPPKPFGGNSFGAMKGFGSSLPSGQ